MGNRSTAVSGWGSTVVIDNGIVEAQVSQVGIDPAGNAVAVWQIQKGFGEPYDIYAAHYK